ncbi:Per os infectivity factor 2 [Trabala vishnou gigantina nucleopolyhedrovirus]|uniref:Per os infectivity factor 2 n=1 Tax=Trabala vishnou gigantina nucleopolyhedrovirus TaxID=2863583 RepID=UPI00248198DB|nr:Per os infectivity factor 2 [Trabala vishnou gigantina nucleopolyhedrovirus]QYC92687.1 Per os infectivity factor 2 [Trabala vishnou gigantina nucleopolyhedrovirus]
MYVTLIILVLLTFVFLLYKPVYDAHSAIKTAQTEYNDTVDLRIDYMENVLKRRHYVPLESLPRIVFNTNLGTVNEGEIKCLSVPVFVGILETPTFDCAQLCDNPSAVYFFVGEYDKFVVNGQMLTRGGYCTTNSVPRNCNRETSVVVHSLNQWSCIAEDPRYFAGPLNMVQVAGRQHFNRIAPGQSRLNVLFDRLLGAEVDVSRNTFRSDWDELMADGERRFEMRCNALDLHNNRMFVNPLNPIECLPNVCTNVERVHPDVRPNFETGECECGDFNVTRLMHSVPGDRTSVCASIVDGFDRNLMSHTFRVECVNMDMSLDKFSRTMLLCPEGTFTQNTDNAYTFILPGSFPLSGNGIDEPTYRFYMQTRNRINYNIVRNIPE